MGDRTQPTEQSGPTPTFESSGEQMDVRDVHAAIMRERSEPMEGHEPTPLWLVTLIGALLFWGGFYLERYSGGFKPLVFDEHSSGQMQQAQAPMKVDMASLGKRTFQNTCQTCHQETGLGLPGQYPPLAGSEWVDAADPSRIIRIVLDGFSGPVQVKRETFNNIMVPWRDTFSDQQIAAVLTYVRQAWGNKAPPVSEDQVKAIREQTKGHAGRPWSVQELEQVPLKE